MAGRQGRSRAGQDGRAAWKGRAAGKIRTATRHGRVRTGCACAMRQLSCRSSRQGFLITQLQQDAPPVGCDPTGIAQWHPQHMAACCYTRCTPTCHNWMQPLHHLCSHKHPALMDCNERKPLPIMALWNPPTQASWLLRTMHATKPHMDALHMSSLLRHTYILYSQADKPGNTPTPAAPHLEAGTHCPVH